MIWGDRSGSEPRNARSPLRLRRGTAVVGAAVCVVAAIAIVLLVEPPPWLPVTVLALGAVVGVVDLLVINRRMRRRRDQS